MCNAGGGRNLSSTHAFTLAEVLVTLGIIGVVSAMTVPSLMQNHQRKTYVTQLHKVYTEFQQAMVQYITEKNAINLREAGINSQAAMNDFVTEHFKVINSCLTKDTKPCFEDPANYRKISGASASGFDNEERMMFTLASGASIRPWYANRGVNFIIMVVDTNGMKGPNIYGRDFFDMCIDVNGNIDGCVSAPTAFPLSSEARDTAFNTFCLGDDNSIQGCFGKILNDNWEMNY